MLNSVYVTTSKFLKGKRLSNKKNVTNLGWFKILFIIIYRIENVLSQFPF